MNMSKNEYCEYEKSTLYLVATTRVVERRAGGVHGVVARRECIACADGGGLGGVARAPVSAARARTLRSASARGQRGRRRTRFHASSYYYA